MLYIRRKINPMTESEVIEDIFNTYKWYVGIFAQSYSYTIKHRYKNNSLSQSTIDLIIKLSGYELSSKRTYQKVI